MHIAVVFTTYNAPVWLEKVLWGFACQEHRDFRIHIADDGSGEETAQLIKRLSAETGLAIDHVWQPDNGFQKCVIMNKALSRVEAPYTVFTDGDCIPRKDFLSWHVRLAEKGRFLSGGYFKLTRPISEAISEEDIRSGRAFDPRWLRAQGQPRRKMTKLRLGPGLGRIFDRLSPTTASWNGHNASGWTADLLAVNGFDERMQYGGQDREFGERLENSGIRGKRIRHRAICLHLDHPRGYDRPESIAKNRAIRAETRKKKIIRSPYGIETTGRED